VFEKGGDILKNDRLNFDCVFYVATMSANQDLIRFLELSQGNLFEGEKLGTVDLLALNSSKQLLLMLPTSFFPFLQNMLP
jgi:hypothetical protein